MKKAVNALVAIGVIVGLRLLARRTGREMREHCEHMAEQWKQMAARSGGRGEAVGRA